MDGIIIEGLINNSIWLIAFARHHMCVQATMLSASMAAATAQVCKPTGIRHKGELRADGNLKTKPDTIDHICREVVLLPGGIPICTTCASPSPARHQPDCGHNPHNPHWTAVSRLTSQKLLVNTPCLAFQGVQVLQCLS